jgi:DNA-binding transcriptional MerR regulator/methylmalonyl-CoA mutase cobalamin-binding subunit
MPVIDTSRETPRHPMRVVIQRTGLSADVLRAWERRYGLVAPDRSEGGQRLYSDEDVERLTLLRRATGGGRNISQISGLGLSELEALIAEDDVSRAATSATPEGRSLAAEFFHEAANRAVDRLDVTELEALLRRAAMQLGSASAVDEVIIPVLHDLGDRWHRGEITPAHEHMGTATIRRVLAWMASAALVPHHAPLAVIATPPNQRHELGAKIVATTAATEGWRVLFLGADLPAEAIAGAAVQSGATLVALSLIFPQEDPRLVPEVARIRQLLPAHVQLVAGGPAATANEAALTPLGVRVMPTLGDLRVLLRSLHPSPSGQ